MSENSDVGSTDVADEEILALQACMADLEAVDFEAPIRGCTSAHYHDFESAFRNAATYHQKLATDDAMPAARVFSLLAAVADFHFKPDDQNEPFGPMLVMGGRRSAIPEDFRGDINEVIATAAARACNPLLKARLCDMSWLLERSRHELGRLAIAAYVDTVEALEAGQLHDRFENDEAVVGLTARDLMKRALTISRRFNMDINEVKRARELLVRVSSRALAIGKPIAIYWFFEMDLDHEVSEQGEVATQIERFAVNCDIESGSEIVANLWRLAARAYHKAKDEDGKNRCRTNAAEVLVLQSELQTSAMLASHWLSAAIAEYHGIPDTRERRTQLRHKLIDVQSGILDEMSSLSHSIDLKDIVEETQVHISKQSDLIDSLFLFASLSRSPDPD